MVKEKKITATEAVHTDFIEVFGAREHNLKDIDIKIPKNQLVVFTGESPVILSTSGRSISPRNWRA